jgi:hypothetical protein
MRADIARSKRVSSEKDSPCWKCHVAKET